MYFRDEEGKEYETDIVTVPFVYVSNSAGMGNPIDDNIDESMAIPIEFIMGIKKPFLINASGDSMSPLIEDKDILICDNIGNGNPQNGDIVSIVLNGERLVKYYYMNHSGIFLASLNQKYQNIYLTEDDEIYIEGVVCQFLRSINNKKIHSGRK